MSLILQSSKPIKRSQETETERLIAHAKKKALGEFEAEQRENLIKSRPTG